MVARTSLTAEIEHSHRPWSASLRSDILIPQSVSRIPFFVIRPPSYLKQKLQDILKPQISKRGRYSISHINQQLTISQYLLKIWCINLFLFCNIVKNLVHLQYILCSLTCFQSLNLNLKPIAYLSKIFRQSPVFFILNLNTFLSHTTNIATLVGLRHPVTILVTDFSSPHKLTNDLLIQNF